MHGEGEVLADPGAMSTYAMHAEAFARDQLLLAIGAIVCVTLALVAALLGRRRRYAGEVLIVCGGGAVASVVMMLARVPERPPEARWPRPTKVDLVVRDQSVELAGEGGAWWGSNLHAVVEQPVELAIYARSPEAIEVGIPGLHLRARVEPGHWRTLRFRPNRVGEAAIFVSTRSEPVRLVVTSEQDFAPPRGCCLGCMFQDGVQWGAELFEQNGCVACHSTDPWIPSTVGPSLADVAGSLRHLESGRHVRADASYLRESLTDPDAAVLDGWSDGPTMPSFAALGDPKIDALVAYLQSLSVYPLAR